MKILYPLAKRFIAGHNFDSAKPKIKNPDHGFTVDFVQQLNQLWQEIKTQNIKVIANAGGINLKSCKKSIQNELINQNIDLKVAKEVSDLILFDGKGYERSVGFNHDLLNSIPNSINKMIAGNIKIEDVTNFKNKHYILDVSGSLESSKGLKDINKIDKLLNLFKKL